MNKLYKTIVLSLALFVGCTDEILETAPANAVTKDIALKDLSGYKALLNSVYNRTHDFGFYGQTINIAPEILADNLVIANNTGRYTGQVVNAVGSHINIWDRYTAINEANIIISNVDKVDGTQGEKDFLKGQALFLRALMYHNMARVYGYEPGKEVNGWDKCVVIRTDGVEALSGADFKERATNEEVYQLIESDLNSAITLIGDNSAKAPNEATKAAAQLLLARVYLYWGKYTQAATMADNAIASAAVDVVDAVDYPAAWSATTHPESLFELDILAADWSTVDGVNNSMNSVTAKHDKDYNETGGQFSIGGSAELIAAFEGGDVRRDLWVDFGGKNENLKWRGERGDYREGIPVLRISEAYLISAEAKARSGNDPGATTAINYLRSRRGLADTALTGQALIDLIMNERRVELCLEGHRFFDLKRLGMDIPKPASLGIPPIPYNDFRIIGPLPNAQVALNSKLLQNPNY